MTTTDLEAMGNSHMEIVSVHVYFHKCIIGRAFENTPIILNWNNISSPGPINFFPMQESYFEEKAEGNCRFQTILECLLEAHAEIDFALEDGILDLRKTLKIVSLNRINGKQIDDYSTIRKKLNNSFRVIRDRIDRHLTTIKRGIEYIAETTEQAAEYHELIMKAKDFKTARASFIYGLDSLEKQRRLIFSN